MTAATITLKAPVTLGERLYRIGFALFGPAQTGPYGPPVPPPTPRPRDRKGRLIVDA